MAKQLWTSSPSYPASLYDACAVFSQGSRDSLSVRPIPGNSKVLNDWLNIKQIQISHLTLCTFTLHLPFNCKPLSTKHHIHEFIVLSSEQKQSNGIFSSSPADGSNNTQLLASATRCQLCSNLTNRRQTPIYEGSSCSSYSNETFKMITYQH